MSQPLGLSANAWRNAKSWADTSFPVNVVTGDRIFRTDIGSSGGVWFTYNGTMWVPDRWAGTVTIPAFVGSATSRFSTVTFGLPSGAGFPATPRIYLTQSNTAGSGVAMTVRALSKTTLDFDAYWGSAAATSNPPAVPIDWLAIPA